MTKNIPTWIMQRYAKLWHKLKNSPFNYEKALEILKEKETLSVVLSELRKAGWIEVKLDPQDIRKRIYILKNPEKAINEILGELK